MLTWLTCWLYKGSGSLDYTPEIDQDNSCMGESRGTDVNDNNQLASHVAATVTGYSKVAISKTSVVQLPINRIIIKTADYWGIS